VKTQPQNSPEVGLLAYLANLTFIFYFVSINVLNSKTLKMISRKLKKTIFRHIWSILAHILEIEEKIN
jgi:hypothetical protein